MGGRRENTAWTRLALGQWIGGGRNAGVSVDWAPSSRKSAIKVIGAAIAYDNPQNRDASRRVCLLAREIAPHYNADTLYSGGVWFSKKAVSPPEGCGIGTKAITASSQLYYRGIRGA
jgi:hypothetical protein